MDLNLLILLAASRSRSNKRSSITPHFFTVMNGSPHITYFTFDAGPTGVQPHHFLNRNINSPFRPSKSTQKRTLPLFALRQAPYPSRSAPCPHPLFPLRSSRPASGRLHPIKPLRPVRVQPVRHIKIPAVVILVRQQPHPVAHRHRQIRRPQ